MLEEYKECQPIAFKILTNSLNQNRYAHAYIFEDNTSNDALSLVLAFVKELLTKDLNEEEKANVISMVDSGNHPEVKRIVSENLWIKKEQIKTLQDEFSKKTIVGNKKIYIIEEAEKLNKSSSNTILKFLEEPEEGIIAILITKNIYQLLDTVKSRCQLIKLTDRISDNENIFSVLDKVDNMTKEEESDKIRSVINFVHFYEKNKVSTICYMQKLWHTYFNTKELSLLGFDILILYYKDVLNFLLGRKIIYFEEDINNIENIFKHQSYFEISKKIETITLFREKIKLNANLNLLMDKLIIELEGGIKCQK